MINTTKLPVQIVDLECNKCKCSNHYPISLMSPDLFCDPQNATILIQYRCNNCNMAQAAKIKFKSEDGFVYAVLLEEIDVKKLLVPPENISITVKPKAKSYKG